MKLALFARLEAKPGKEKEVAMRGPIAQALMAQAPALFATPPSIEPLEVLGAKLPA